MSQAIRDQGGHLVFPIGPKNTNLVEDIEILLPVNFLWIMLSGFRGKVKNISANQMPGQPSCFSDWPKKHKLGRGIWDLASCQVLFNSVQRRSRKCEKLTTDDGRTDDGQPLWLRCTKSKHLKYWRRMEFLISASQALNSYLLTDLLDIEEGLIQ